jgi:nitrogen fixation protein FixH
MKPSFHWGYGILISFLLFTLFMLSFLIRAIWSGGADMVESDAYEKGNLYSERYAQISNAQEAELSFNVEEKNDSLYFKYSSPTHQPRLCAGTALFFRPSDERQDFQINFQMDSSGGFRVFKNLFSSGHWKIKAEWKAENKNYYMNNAFWVK